MVNLAEWSCSSLRGRKIGGIYQEGVYLGRKDSGDGQPPKRCLIETAKWGLLVCKPKANELKTVQLWRCHGELNTCTLDRCAQYPHEDIRIHE